MHLSVMRRSPGRATVRSYRGPTLRATVGCTDSALRGERCHRAVRTPLASGGSTSSKRKPARPVEVEPLALYGRPRGLVEFRNRSDAAVPIDSACYREVPATIRNFPGFPPPCSWPIPQHVPRTVAASLQCNHGANAVGVRGACRSASWLADTPGRKYGNGARLYHYGARLFHSGAKPPSRAGPRSRACASAGTASLG